MNSRLIPVTCLVLMLSGCSTALPPLSQRMTTNNGQQAPVMQPSTLPAAGMPATDNAVFGRSMRRGPGFVSRATTAQEPAAAPSTPSMAYLKRPSNLYQAQYLHKTLDGYAQQLAMDLVANLRDKDPHKRLAVASLVELSSSLQDTTLLGNLMAEKLITEMQVLGLTVVDYKAMDLIKVGAQGDLVFSRKVKELARRQQVDYVLSGTMVRQGRGVQIQARIIALDDKKVISTASGFVPGMVVSTLYPEWVIEG